MVDVQFNENQDLYQFRSRTILGTPQVPKLVSLVMKFGVVKTEQGAGRLLIVIAIIAFSLSIYLFISAAST